MGPAPIPFDGILSYAQWKGLDASETDAFATIIEAMDRAWLEWQEKKGTAPEDGP